MTSTDRTENTDAATHCVTRPRFALVVEDIVGNDALDQLDIVIGTFRKMSNTKSSIVKVQ